MTAEEAKQHLKAFSEIRVGHKAARTARDALLSKSLSASDERIIFLVGPSRVGKTSLLHRVRERLIEHHREEMLLDLSFSPLIYMEAVPGFKGEFDWKDGFARLLAAGNEPLIARKASFLNLTLDGCEIVSTRGLITAQFRRAFESMVANRRIKYLFLDEGSAIVNALVQRNQLSQFNVLRSICSKLGVIIIIAGAYDLANYRDGNGQLVGRSESIHVKRYGLNQEDLADFLDAAQTLSDRLPLAVQENILSDPAMVLIKSVGCVGHFSEWLYRASVQALMTNEGVLTEELFFENSLPNWMIAKLTKEAQLGEKDMEDVAECEIAALYGAKSIHGLEVVTVEPPKPVKRKVGQRSPSRDPVGTDPLSH